MEHVTAVNKNGHLSIGGMDTVALAAKYGTPLYVMDENAIRSNCRALKNSLDSHYNKNGLVLYASKAFCCKRMYRILSDEGLGADVVSGGELYTAQFCTQARHLPPLLQPNLLPRTGCGLTLSAVANFFC
ncbi:MAG: hypothetical protein RSD27_09165 [Ruthenibacterium sp.]